jgi:hypothetical protein
MASPNLVDLVDPVAVYVKSEPICDVIFESEYAWIVITSPEVFTLNAAATAATA